MIGGAGRKENYEFLIWEPEMRLNLTILTIVSALAGCGGVSSAPKMPKNSSGTFADNAPKASKEGDNSIGVQQKTFVVASSRSVMEKLTLLNAEHAGIPLPGQKLETAEESFAQSLVSGAPRARFDLAGKPSSVGKVSVFFGNDQQAADSFTYDKILNAVTLKNPPAQYTPIRIRYQVVSGTASVKGAVAALSRIPDKSSPFTLVSNPGCSVASGGVVLEKDVMTVLCTELDVGSELTVEYSYFDSALQVYEMKDVKTPEEGIWEVLLDGKTFSDFTRDGTKIIISSYLKQGSQVEISFVRNRTK